MFQGRQRKLKWPGQPHGPCWKTTERWRKVGTPNEEYLKLPLRFGVNCFFNVDTKRLVPP